MLLKGCLFKVLYYRPPKPESFKLYRSSKQGIHGTSALKTNGLYYFFEEHPGYDPPNQKRIRYYRFKPNGEIYLSLAHLKPNIDSLYHIVEESIEKNLDKPYYGYYSATGIIIEMEFLKEEREFFGRDHRYHSYGNLSMNGDTLYVAEEIYDNKNKSSQVNRVCIYYGFPIK